MKKLLFKLGLGVFFMAFLSGQYLNLSLMDNVIRSAAIFLLFSALILLIVFIYNQSSTELTGRGMHSTQSASAIHRNQGR